MPKMTKAQARRRLMEIKSKAAKILFNDNYDVASAMSIKDYTAIAKIVDRGLRVLK